MKRIIFEAEWHYRIRESLEISTWDKGMQEPHNGARTAPPINGIEESPRLPLRVCVAGIGGFAAAHHGAIRQLEEEGVVRLVATCDPRWEKLEAEIRKFDFHQRKVEVLPDCDTMLGEVAGRCDLVTIATPLFLHAPMHAMSVDRQFACYLEKPPTLNPPELESMIEKDRFARFQTQVGFSHTVEPWRQHLKTRIMSGEFGEVRSVSFIGAWQRDCRYYTRASWAGKLQINGDPVLDSCFGNAMSHHAHQALFFASTASLFSWAVVERVRAELYHAHPIDSADTVFSEAVTSDGVIIRAAMSHACTAARLTEERIECRRATIKIVPHVSAEITHSTGEVECLDLGPRRSNLVENIHHYVNYVVGRQARPLTTLEDSRPFVCWNALNYLAADGIHEIHPLYRECKPGRHTGEPGWVIPGVENSLRNFASGQGFPSEARMPWARPGGQATLDDLPRLKAKISQLADERAKSLEAQNS